MTIPMANMATNSFSAANPTDFESTGFMSDLLVELIVESYSSTNGQSFLKSFSLSQSSCLIDTHWYKVLEKLVRFRNIPQSQQVAETEREASGLGAFPSYVGLYSRSSTGDVTEGAGGCLLPAYENTFDACGISIPALRTVLWTPKS